jgi:Uma2 family endonuclease
MPVTIDRDLQMDRIYDATESDYFDHLRIEDYMEAFDHAQQREITVESFALIRAERKDVHFFNEMVVLYPSSDEKRPRRVCPDNMVVLHDGELTVDRSYRLPQQPAGPFLVLEFVSPLHRKKDYQCNMLHYEAALKVPYYLTYLAEQKELILYRHNGESYERTKPNAQGRFPIPELELEAGLHHGWVRYWFRGQLLPLPAELLGQLKSTRDQLDAERNRRMELENELKALREQVGKPS